MEEQKSKQTDATEIDELIGGEWRKRAERQTQSVHQALHCIAAAMDMLDKATGKDGTGFTPELRQKFDLAIASIVAGLSAACDVPCDHAPAVYATRLSSVKKKNPDLAARMEYVKRAIVNGYGE